MPDAPVLQSTGVSSTGGFALSWPPVSGAIDYVLQAGSSRGASDVYSASIGARTSLSSVLAPGFSAYARLFALGGCGLSAPSNEIFLSSACPTVSASGPTGIFRGLTSQGRDLEIRLEQRGITQFQFEGIARNADPACPDLFFGASSTREWELTPR